MKGAITDPCEAINTTAIVTKAMAKGRSQYFFLAAAYLYICLIISSDFIRTDLLD